jgi:hypothetical protein
VSQARPRVAKRRRPPAERAAAPAEEFIPLDNEPFEAGLVVRVALGLDQIPADVIYSADGRARAYRLVNVNSNE